MFVKRVCLKSSNVPLKDTDRSTVRRLSQVARKKRFLNLHIVRAASLIQRITTGLMGRAFSFGI